jgi:hypothetical protein
MPEKSKTPLSDRLETQRRAFQQPSSPPYADCLALARRLEEYLENAKQREVLMLKNIEHLQSDISTRNDTIVQLREHQAYIEGQLYDAQKEVTEQRIIIGEQEEELIRLR